MAELVRRTFAGQVLLLLLIVSSASASNRYEIRATIDAAHNALRGTERIIFLNDLGRPVDSILVAHDENPSGPQFSVLDGKGRQLRVEAGPGGAPVRVFLESTLAPGARAELRISFNARARSKDGYNVVSGAWHPKIVATITGDFDREQRQPDTYDVIVTLPSDQVLVSSGSEVPLEPGAPSGSEASRASSHVVSSAIAERTLRFRADHVSDFGLVFSSRLKSAIRHRDSVEIRSYYFEGGEKWGQQLPEYAADVIDFYTQTYGYYPQPTLAILPGSKTSGGGYPLASNIIVIHDTLDGRGGDGFARWITAHEIGHQYWGWDDVIDDGRYFHWPGLALGIYGDRLYNEARNPAGLSEHRRLVNSYLTGVASNYDTTIHTTNAEQDRLPFDATSVVAHGKGFAVVQMLADVIGRERMLTLLRTLLARYRNRYLSFASFETAAEEAAGEKLGWFFRQWVDGNQVLSYRVAEVQQVDGEVRVVVTRTGTAVMPMDLQLEMESGERLSQRITGEPQVQTVVFKATGRVRHARLDPDQRMALYSPVDEHVWGRLIEVVDTRFDGPPAWGTNGVSITIRNTDTRPHEVEADCQVRSASPARGSGGQIKVVVAAGESLSFAHACTFPPFPGKANARLRVNDATDNLRVFLRDVPADFPFANDRTNPVRLSAALQASLKSQRSEYARLMKSELGHFVFYCFEDDTFARSHLEDEARRREEVYRKLVEQLNPAFSDRIAIYLFPDQISKRALTTHQGMGWATGRLIFEVFNEKERVDPFHEITHIVADTIGEPPALLSEGFAAYMQEGHKWDGFDIDAWSQAFLAGKMLWPIARLMTFEEIGSAGTRPPIAYPQAASFVKFLIDEYGFDTFLAAYRGLKRSGDESVQRKNSQEFARIVGVTVETAERLWIEKLGRIRTEPIPPARLDAIRKDGAGRP